MWSLSIFASFELSLCLVLNVTGSNDNLNHENNPRFTSFLLNKQTSNLHNCRTSAPLYFVPNSERSASMQSPVSTFLSFFDPSSSNEKQRMKKKKSFETERFGVGLG